MGAASRSEDNGRQGRGMTCISALGHSSHSSVIPRPSHPLAVAVMYNGYREYPPAPCLPSPLTAPQHQQATRPREATRPTCLPTPRVRNRSAHPCPGCPCRPSPRAVAGSVPGCPCRHSPPRRTVPDRRGWECPLMRMEWFPSQTKLPPSDRDRPPPPPWDSVTPSSGDRCGPRRRGMGSDRRRDWGTGSPRWAGMRLIMARRGCLVRLI